MQTEPTFECFHQSQVYLFTFFLFLIFTGEYDFIANSLSVEFLSKAMVLLGSQHQLTFYHTDFDELYT